MIRTRDLDFEFTSCFICFKTILKLNDVKEQALGLHLVLQFVLSSAVCARFSGVGLLPASGVVTAVAALNLWSVWRLGSASMQGQLLFSLHVVSEPFLAYGFIMWSLQHISWNFYLVPPDSNICKCWSVTGEGSPPWLGVQDLGISGKELTETDTKV